jgi:hypothetical protein
VYAQARGAAPGAAWVRYAAHSSWRLPIGRSELLLPAETCSGCVLCLSRAASVGPMQGPCMGAAFPPPGSRRLPAAVVCGTKPCFRGAGSPFSVFEGPRPPWSLALSARSGTAAPTQSAAVALQRQADHGWPFLSVGFISRSCRAARRTRCSRTARLPGQLLGVVAATGLLMAG